MDNKNCCIKCGSEAVQGSTMCRKCRECFDYRSLIDGFVDKELLEKRIISLEQTIHERQKSIDYLSEVSFLQQASVIMIKKKLREDYGVKEGTL